MVLWRINTIHYITLIYSPWQSGIGPDQGWGRLLNQSLTDIAGSANQSHADLIPTAGSVPLLILTQAMEI